MNIEITQRKRIEDTQRFLLSAGWAKSNQEFFHSLAGYLSGSLGMNYVSINRLLPDNLVAYPLAIYYNGKIGENIAFNLKDTPCGETLGKTICRFDRNIRDLFPNISVIQDIKAESYAGTTLWSSEGKPIGLIVLMNDQPIENPSHIELVLNLVASRTAGEIERQDTETALVQSRKAFQNYFQNCSVGMSVTSPEKKWLEVNQCLCQMLGYTKEELQELSWVDVSFSEDIEKNLLLFTLMTEGHLDRYEMDKRFVKKDGSIVYVSLSAVCERNPDGSVHHLLASYVDITERKLVEEALKSSEELYRNLVEKLPDGVYKSTHDGQFVSVNPAMVNMLGYANKEELMAVDIQKELYFEPEDRNRLVSEEVEGEFDVYKLKRKDGSEVWVEDHSWYNTDEKENILYHEGILRDITERMRVEVKLRILSQAVEQNPASTIITNAIGKIEFVNAAFTKMTHYTLDEVVHKSPRIFNRGHLKDADFDSMWKILASGKVWKGEFQNRNKEGFSYWENVAISSLTNDRGAISNYILIMDDISAEKKMLNDLITAKETAEESNRLKSAFLATMNHELRTPLNHILGFSELIMSGVAPEDNISFASSIQSSGQSLLSIIEGIFDLALVEQSNIKLRKQTFSLMDHFMENKASFDNILQTSAKRDQIKLIFRPDTRWLSSYVTADRSKINQVLTNLFKNAVKFTHKGTIEFGYRIENESKLMFYVKDTGIGIPKEKQNIIFDYFRQGDDTYTRVYGGIGIGLSIAKKISKILQGELKVVSEPGFGSTFSLTLPVDISDTKG